MLLDIFLISIDFFVIFYETVYISKVYILTRYFKVDVMTQVVPGLDVLITTVKSAQTVDY